MVKRTKKKRSPKCDTIPLAELPPTAHLVGNILTPVDPPGAGWRCPRCGVSPGGAEDNAAHIAWGGCG